MLALLTCFTHTHLEQEALLVYASTEVQQPLREKLFTLELQSNLKLITDNANASHIRLLASELHYKLHCIVSEYKSSLVAALRKRRKGEQLLLGFDSYMNEREVFTALLSSPRASN